MGYDIKKDARIRLGYEYFRVDGVNGKEVFVSEDKPGGAKKILQKSWLRENWDSNQFGYEPSYYAVDLIAPEGAVEPKRSLAAVAPHRARAALWKEAYVTLFQEAMASGKCTDTNPPIKYAMTYRAAEAAAKELQPIVDALGHLREEEIRKVLKKHKPGSNRKTRAGQDVTVVSKMYPSGKTLLKWERKYRRNKGDVLCLVDNTNLSGWWGSHMIPSVLKIVQEVIANDYLKDNRIGPKQVTEKVGKLLEDLNAKLVAVGMATYEAPSRKSVTRYINKIDPFFRDVCRHGLAHARRYAFRHAEQLETNVPGARIEMDEYEVDVFALFCLSHAYDLLSEEEKTKLARVRLFLCIVIDHATKMILGMRLSPAPSDENAKAALSMVEQDKSIYSAAAGCLTAWTEHCGLATVAMDGGYATEDIRMSIAMGGGTSAYMPKGHPAMRGTVESIFATVGARVLSEYEGKAFSNTILREDYKSEKRAGSTIDELALIMCTWVFDDYHNSPHAGLKGLTPREAWKRGFELFDLRPPLDAHGRRCAYGQKVTRTLTAEGFEFFGNFYREHRHLPKLYDPKNSCEFECFVDQRNLGAIGVIVGERVIAVPCATPWMEGVDAIDWVETNKRFQIENADRRVFEREAVRHAMERMVAIKGNAIHRQLISATVWNADQIAEIQASTFTPYSFVSSAAAAPLGERIEPIEVPPRPSTLTEPADPPAHAARKWETE